MVFDVRYSDLLLVNYRCEVLSLETFSVCVNSISKRAVANIFWLDMVRSDERGSAF